MTFTVQFLGSGDAFGSGGRFQACIHVKGASTNMLVDCGASFRQPRLSYRLYANH